MSEIAAATSSMETLSTGRLSPKRGLPMASDTYYDRKTNIMTPIGWSGEL